jgi:hypothetical protein
VSRLPSRYHFDNPRLAKLATLLAQALPERAMLTTSLEQAGLDGAVTVPEGEMYDRWHRVVRQCYDREERLQCLTNLIDVTQKRLSGTENGEMLARLVEDARQDQGSVDRATASTAVAALRERMERLLELDDPTLSGGLCGEIRAEVLTVWRLLENESTAAGLMVGVSVVPEASQDIRDALISACMAMVSAVDRLRGRIRMGGTMLEDTGSALRDSHEDVLRATYRLDAVIDARDMAIRRGRRLLRLVDEQLPLTASRRALSGRGDAA